MKNRPLETRFLQTVTSLTDKTKFSGYAVRYNSPSEYMGFIEIIKPNALVKSLSESKRIIATFNHDDSKLLGSTDAGTLRLDNRSDGLYFDLDIPNTSYAQDVLTLIERGDISGCSFGMYVIKERTYQDNGIQYREILEAKIVEVSIVVTPAYSATEVEAREMPDEKNIESETTISIEADTSYVETSETIETREAVDVDNTPVQEPLQPDYTLIMVEIDILKYKYLYIKD